MIAMSASTPSTPGDPSEGVLTGVRRIAEEADTEIGNIRNILHGTTVATNAVLALAPFSHVMGFVIALGSALLAGARVVPVPRFEPAGFLPLLARERVTVVIVPPPVMPLLARSPVDLRAVELIVCGGAPLGADLQRAVSERFPHAAVGQGYGLTETTACATIGHGAAEAGLRGTDSSRATVASTRSAGS